MRHSTLLISFFFLHQSALAYKAAVYEYYPSVSNDPTATIAANLKEYKDFAAKAKANNDADILVFPEYGLTTLVKDPREYSIEIDDNQSVIKDLKSIATDNQVNLVVNLVEKAQTGSKTEYYNTNLVFDRNGQIISKYRKINLFREPYLTPGTANQSLSFITDFGVTFGVFTGSDILYQNPAQKVLNESSVTDVVYPTSFSAVMPFHTPLSLQYGYAQANGVNLLAAGYDQPKESRGGSGIYLADGKIAESFISESGSSKPLVQEVTKISARVEKSQCLSFSPLGLPGPTNTTIGDYVTLDDFPKSKFHYKNLNLSSTKSTEVCCGEFCCTFDVIVESKSDSAVYKLAAYDGHIKYEDFSGHVRLCSLLVCSSDSISSCGARINDSTKFTKIDVKGNFRKEEGTYYRPVSLRYDLGPIIQSTFCDTDNGTDSTFVQFQTLGRQEEVLVFGVFGKVSAASALHGFGAACLYLAALFALLL